MGSQVLKIRCERIGFLVPARSTRRIERRRREADCEAIVAESGENWVGTQFARLIEIFYELKRNTISNEWTDSVRIAQNFCKEFMRDRFSVGSQIV